MKNLHDDKLRVLESAWSSTYSLMANDFTFASGGEGMWEPTLHASRVGQDMTNISLPMIPPYIDKVVSGVTDHPDRGQMGEWLEFEEGNDPWERSKHAMCNMWHEWDGMQAVVAEEREKQAHGK